MNLSTLSKTVTKSKRRRGQGHGSGRMKTSGRGTKGQKSRNKVPMTRYSGGSLAFVKSLPFLRGKGKNYSLQTITFPVNVGMLNSLPKDTVVDVATLVKYNIVSRRTAKNQPIKVLGNGELTVALSVKLPVSKSALKKIEKAGGKLEK